jgi:hypothetical protein
MNQEISVDDLPIHTPWPHRILGLEDFQRKPRDSQENKREYDSEKWKNALDEYLSHPERPNFSQFLQKELAKEKDHPVFWQKKLIMMSSEDSFGLQVELIAQAVEKYLPAPALVELGAGTGRVLFSLAKRFQSNAGQLIAAEFSENGRHLIKEISLASSIDVEVLHCDFTEDQFVKKLPEGAVLLTSMSTVCIPQLRKQFIDSIIAFKPKIVIHFEPIYEHCSDGSLLSLMQRRYIDINHYNNNLLEIIKNAELDGRIKILNEVPAILGTNPFLVASLIEWAPI